jgi:uncharacterized membrane protein YccC
VRERSVMNRPSPFWIRHAALVFSMKTFAAAMLALVTALLLDMQRPYWAMLTVYITAQPLVGATFSKAAYRIIGTVIGAAATVVAIPNLVNAPELLCLAIASWVGLCVYLSLLDGTPRSYAFMLAGYTVAVIGFPSVSAPETVFDTAVARVQEISLGILCASLFSTLVLPRSVSSALTPRVDAWLLDARRLSHDVLVGDGTEQEREVRRMRLAADAAEMETFAIHLGYETAADANMVPGLNQLRLPMTAHLTLLAAIEDRLVALRSGGRTLPPRLSGICSELARWLAEGGREWEQADALRADLPTALPPLGENASWAQIMAADLVMRLRQLLDVAQDCHALREAIAAGRDPAEVVLAFSPGVTPAVVRPRDRWLALWAAAGAPASVLTCCAVWIGTGWPDGASAAIFAAVVGSRFAAQDNPPAVIRTSFKVVLASVLVVGFYLFVVMPQVTTIEVLIAVLMPAFVLFGYLAARPKTASLGTLLAIFVALQLALESSYTASFASFVNASISLLLGVAITGIVCGVVRASGAEWTARRLLRSNWTTLATVAESRGRQDRAALASVMLYRLALIAARLAVLPDDARKEAANLRPLRAGLNIIELGRARPGLSRRTLALIDDMLARLARDCRAHTGGPLPYDLVTTLDMAMAAALQEPAGDTRNAAVTGLIGIRSALFPEAPADEPTPDQPRLVA